MRASGSLFIRLALGAVLITANVISNVFDDPVLYQTRSLACSRSKRMECASAEARHYQPRHAALCSRGCDERWLLTRQPYGQVFAAFGGRIQAYCRDRTRHIAALANYAAQGQSLTFTKSIGCGEIAQIPAVYVYDDAIRRGSICGGGDARLKIGGSDGAYDMIILDAFTSDDPGSSLTRSYGDVPAKKPLMACWLFTSRIGISRLSRYWGISGMSFIYLDSYNSERRMTRSCNMRRTLWSWPKRKKRSVPWARIHGGSHCKNPQRSASGPMISPTS